jgi:hypothetical protein
MGGNMKHILAATCLALFLLASCTSTQPIEKINGMDVGLFVPLHWENPGSIDPKPGILNLGKSPFAVVLLDGRSDQVIVGHSSKNGRYIATKNSIVEAYTAPVSGLFQNAGLPVSKTAENLALEITINKLFVEEGNIYRGQAEASVRILKDGKAVWSGSAVGSAKRWGRTFSMTNYDEALTNSLADLVDRLTDDSQFLQGAASALQ